MIDLHTHTTASDGALSPKKLVKKAKETDLLAIAVTDHDQVAGIPEALKAGKEYGVEVIPGVELSTYWLGENRKEFHILGYFIDWQAPNLLEKLDFFQKEREKRARKSLKILNDLGYQADWENLRQIAKGSIGKPHIARVVMENSQNESLLKKTFITIPTMSEFIQKYMIPGKPAYVEKSGFDPKQAIVLIKEAGGVPILAHPCFDVPIGDLETVKTLMEWGIEGLEAIAPFKTPEQTRLTIEYFSKVAQDFNLIATGGSDYHGLDGIGAGLGLFEWGMKIEDEILEKLKAVAQNASPVAF